MDEFEQEMLKIQAEVHAEDVQHEGQGPEEAYASRLAELSLTEGEVPDGKAVIKALLIRCTLWIEIMRQKCVNPLEYIDCFSTNPLAIDKAPSTNASQNSTTNYAKSEVN